MDDGERVGYIARISERYGVGEIERFTGKSEEQILRDAGLVNDDKLRNMIMGEESEQTITNGINLKPHVIMDGDRVRPAVVGELIDDGITIRLQATRADKGGIDGRATMVVNGVSNEYHFEGDGMCVWEYVSILKMILESSFGMVGEKVYSIVLTRNRYRWTIMMG